LPLRAVNCKSAIQAATSSGDQRQFASVKRLLGEAFKPDAPLVKNDGCSSGCN
jgi:hypothetical protein